MKVFRRIGVSVLIILFLTTGLSYGESVGRQSFTKGIDCAAQGKFKEAKEEFVKISKVDPFYEPAKEALKVIVDVIDRKIESEAAIHLFKGVAYVLKGKYDEAISDFTKAIEINPKFADAYFSRGAAFGIKCQHDQAISDYNKAIEINPKYAKAYNNRGIIHINKGNKEKACSDWKQACNLGNCKILNFAKKKGDCQ